MKYFAIRGVSIAISEAKQLLEKEKEQIIEAYEMGYLNDIHPDDVRCHLAEQYYNETYNN